MHDPVRVKLDKGQAFGTVKAAAEAQGHAVAAHHARIELLRRAQTLDERIGVKGRIGQPKTLLRQPAAHAA